MKALVVTDRHTLELRDFEPPTPGPFEALVKIAACGICSTTDSEIVRGTQPYHNQYPCLLGHEAVGEVVEVGAKVRKFRVGDWVTRPTAIWPGTSRGGLASGWGGFAEFGIVRDAEAMAAAGDASLLNDYTAVRQNVFPADIGVRGGVSSIALAETLSWSRHLSLSGKTVCVAGTGIAGLSLVLWSKLAGAKQVIVVGRRDERLALARSLGADVGVNAKTKPPAESVKAVSSGGVDVFMEASGAPDQLRTALQSIRAGGTVAIYGVAPNGQYQLDWKWLPADVRIVQPPADEHLAAADVVKMILAKQVPVDRLLTHQWPLSEYAAAFEAVHAGQVVKSMLVMG